MQRLLDLILPPRCIGCDVEGELLCARCRKPLESRLRQPPGAPIGLPVTLPDGLLQLEWCGTFNGVARRSIHALKYGGEQRLVEPLAALLAERWRFAGAGGELLVPVPIHLERRRERGFNQAELLARAVGRRLGLPTVDAIERTERTVAQHALGRTARTSNVSVAFHVPDRNAPLISGHWIVLIDDVITTGATLGACANAALAAGALAVSALTLARER